MPAIEGIVLMLETQFDADTIPEAAIADASASDERSVDIYVPSFLASQFWLSYTINPAMLAPAHAPTKYMFFKLLLDGECVVSWGVGEKDEWKGKTMWAFFRGEDNGGWRTVDKRAFFFRPTGDDQDFDVLAYRARGRRQACRQFDDMPPPGETGFDLLNWGRLKEHHPQTFYQYALMDPVDQPYATFRYHIRGGPHVKARRSDQRPERYSSDDSYLDADDHLEGVADELPDPVQLRRLSYPPSIRLTPTSSSTEPSSPTKLDPDLPAPPEIGLSTILDPEPSVSAGLPPTSTSPATSEPALETPDESEKERLSSVDTVLRRHFVRTPTPVVTDQHATATPPSSLRKRSGAKIKEWFGSVSKRRATRSTSPIHPALSHKASSASFS